MATAVTLTRCYNSRGGLIHLARAACRCTPFRSRNTSTGPAQSSSNEEKSMNRIVHCRGSSRPQLSARPGSTISLATALALLFVGIASKQMVDVAGPLPPIDPVQRVQPLLVYVSGGQPPAQTDTDILMRSLANPIDFSRFLQTHARHVICPDAPTFLREYRLSLADLQAKGWQGDCNDLTNAMCEASFANGYSLGVLSMWPRQWNKRLTQSWHQVAVFCVKRDEEYIIFDNGRPIHWRGSLQDYARSTNRAIPPLGGVMTWRPMKSSPLARLLDHLRWNEELPENTLPSQTPRRPSMI